MVSLQKVFGILNLKQILINWNQPILKPYFDLRFSKVECLGEVGPLIARQVLLPLEPPLERGDLRLGESSPRSLLLLAVSPLIGRRVLLCQERIRSVFVRRSLVGVEVGGTRRRGFWWGVWVCRAQRWRRPDKVCVHRNVGAVHRVWLQSVWKIELLFSWMN